MLTSTGTPHSLSPSPEAVSPVEEAAPISVPGDVPSRPPYRRPDVRLPGESEIEKLLTVENDLNRISSDIKESLTFEFPSSEAREPQRFSLVLELSRQGGVLRSTVRMRRSPTQLELPLEDLQLPIPF
jgi:hypothetical protein